MNSETSPTPAKPVPSAALLRLGCNFGYSKKAYKPKQPNQPITTFILQSLIAEHQIREELQCMQHGLSDFDSHHLGHLL